MTLYIAGLDLTGSKLEGILGSGTGVAKIYYDSVNNPLGGGNTITDNLTNGMRIKAGAYPILGWTASTTPGNNTIADNDGKAIYNQNPSFIFANCNYWGGTPLPADFYGLVYYDPWYGSNGVCDQYAALPGNSLSEWLYAMLDVIPSYLYAQSDVVGALNRDATDEFVSGNYSKAIGMFKSVVKDFPNSDGVQYALTLAYDWLFRCNRAVIPIVIGHLPILSLSKPNIFQSVRLGKNIFRFSHRFSFKIYLVSIVNEPIHNRICNGRIVKVAVPLTDGKLTRYDSASSLNPILDELQYLL